MDDLFHADPIEFLLERLPAIRDVYSLRAPMLYAHGNPHVVYGSILVDFLHSLAAARSEANRAETDSILFRAFNLIDYLSSSEQIEFQNLAETSVLEGLLGERGGMEQFAPYMGSATKRLAKRIADRWALDFSILD